MSSSFPDRVTRLLKIRVGEHPNRDRNQVGTLLSLPKDGATTLRTEMERYDPTAVPLTRIAFVGAGNEPNLISPEPCLNSERASCPALAFEAMAHGDANRVALAHEPKLSAATRGLVVCHSSRPLP